MDSHKRKYPRTFHVPFSPGATKDDRKAQDLSFLVKKPLLLTEKMDGSNVCLTRESLYARSHSGPPSHPSFDLLKAHHARCRFDIPEYIEVYGEWLYAVHSIRYDRLPSYLQIFGVRDGTHWWSWEDTREMANEIAAATVPAILEFTPSSEDEIRSKIEVVALHNFFKPACGDLREGVVVRPLGDFWQDEFETHVVKWVRANHVQTDDHWKHKAIETNGLVNA